MDILKRIIKNKIIEIKKAKEKQPLEDLITKVEKCPNTRNFKKAIIKKNKLCIIAEIKKASPSAGVIRRNFNPVQLAISFAKAGVDALSVLTDKKFFKGDLSYIKRIKSRLKLPILRKDFIIDEYQLYQSRAYGADAVLLITRILSKNKLEKLYHLAKLLKMSPIVEVHTRSDLKKALKLNPEIIGINNRDLASLRIDIKTTKRLISLIPKKIIVISESGIKTGADFEFVKSAKPNALLIGEAFMRQMWFK